MDLFEEVTRTTLADDEVVQPVLGDDVKQRLLTWRDRINESAGKESPEPAEAMQVGSFTCLIENAADAIGKLHDAYHEGPSS